MYVNDGNRDKILWVGGLPKPKDVTEKSVLSGHLRDILGVAAATEIDVRFGAGGKNAYAFVLLASSKEVQEKISQLNGTVHQLLKQRRVLKLNTVTLNPKSSDAVASPTTRAVAPTVGTPPVRAVPSSSPTAVVKKRKKTLSLKARQVHAELYEVVIQAKNLEHPQVRLVCSNHELTVVESRIGEAASLTPFEILVDLSAEELAIFRITIPLTAKRAALEAFDHNHLCSARVLIMRLDVLRKETRKRCLT